jgi:hypothetical protein
MMDFGKAFTYPFDDPDWLKKLAIIALLSLIPIFGQFVLIGYVVEIVRRVIVHESILLPDVANIGGFFVKGWKGFVISLVYGLPAFLLLMIFGLVMAFSSSQDGTVFDVITFLTICLMCLPIFYLIFCALIVPAAIGRYAATGEIRDGLNFGKVFRLLRAAPSAYLLVFLGSILSSFISGLGTPILVIGAAFTGAYAATINAHLTGQAYNQAEGIDIPR